MNYIRRVDVDHFPTYFLEKVESIEIKPFSNEVVIKTFREFYNANDEILKTEIGEEAVLDKSKYTAFINKSKIDLQEINTAIKENINIVFGGN